MKQTIIAFSIVFAVISCAPDPKAPLGIDLSDSVLAKRPTWKAYYCDTIFYRSDSLPCIESFTRNVIRHDNYYIESTDRSVGNKISVLRDTFFITPSGNWYQMHNGAWDLFFSKTSFASKTKTYIRRNNFRSDNLKEYTPDSHYVSKKYGPMYRFKLKFPLSREPEDISVDFSPYYGQVSIIGKWQMSRISHIDSTQ